MKKEKLIDFKPLHLKELRLEVEKLIVKKEKHEQGIVEKIKKVFKF